MAKINISIDDELLKRVDRVADNNYMTRSGLVSSACAQFVNTHEMMALLNDISLCVRKIAAEGSIDDESKKQLEDFERMLNFLALK